MVFEDKRRFAPAGKPAPVQADAARRQLFLCRLSIFQSFVEVDFYAYYRISTVTVLFFFDRGLVEFILSC
jgi:hypothetical protein